MERREYERKKWEIKGEKGEGGCEQGLRTESEGREGEMKWGRRV